MIAGEIPRCERGLSRRELEVETLMLSGIQTKVIAQQLGVSPRTIEVHRMRILEKRGCPTLPMLMARRIAELEGEVARLKDAPRQHEERNRRAAAEAVDQQDHTHGRTA